MVAQRDHVAQKAGRADLGAGVAHLNRAPVRLIGDRAVAAQQVRHQRAVALRPLFGEQQIRAVLEMLERHVEMIDAVAVVVPDRGAGRFLHAHDAHVHRCPGHLGQVAGDRLDHRLAGREAGVGERVQIELQRLGFDDVRRDAGHHQLGHGHHRLAALVEPGQLIGVPDVLAVERQPRLALGGGVQVQAFAGVPTGHRAQQRRRVLVDESAGAAQRRVVEKAHVDYPRIPVPRRSSHSASRKNTTVKAKIAAREAYTLTSLTPSTP